MSEQGKWAGSCGARVIILALVLTTYQWVPPRSMAAGAVEARGGEILAAGDRIRNSAASFVVTTRLTEYDKGIAGSSTTLRVYSKLDPNTGQYRNLARYVEPPSDLGKMFLMNGEVMWFYDPAAATGIRISPQQRLLGEASVADVLSLNLSRDYKANLVGEETVVDADRKSVDSWHLNLTASDGSAIYARVEDWLQKGTYYPVKACFYSDSGRKLKTAYYLGMAHVLGGVRPTRVIILDEVNPNVATEITFSDIQRATIPDQWFQHEYLPRLR